MCSEESKNKMSGKPSVAEDGFKTLTGVELHSLSHEDMNSQDEHDMAVLGRAQELNVSENSISRPRDKAELCTTAQLSFYFNVGICVHVDEHVGNISDVSSLSGCLMRCLMITVHRTSFYGLLNGGPAGLVWGYLITWLGYLLVFASVSEMASISPTSGGQVYICSAANRDKG